MVFDIPRFQQEKVEVCCRLLQTLKMWMMVMMQQMQMMRHNTKVVSTGASLNVVAQLRGQVTKSSSTSAIVSTYIVPINKEESQPCYCVFNYSRIFLCPYCKSQGDLTGHHDVENAFSGLYVYSNALYYSFQISLHDNISQLRVTVMFSISVLWLTFLRYFCIHVILFEFFYDHPKETFAKMKQYTQVTCNSSASVIKLMLSIQFKEGDLKKLKIVLLVICELIF